jgi:hypothetical protein
MNYNSLSDKELLNYLDLYNDDPLVRRLLKILEEGSIVQELVDAGMDPTDRTFEHDWQHLSPGDYIEQLRRDMEYHIDERDEIELEKEHLEREVTRLSTMSLVKFIADVSEKLDVATSEMHRAQRIAENEKKLRQESEQKFEFWEKLNHGIK